MVLFRQAGAQNLTYTSSATTPLGHAFFGLSTYSGNTGYHIYMDLPASAIGHISYASMRTEGAYSDVSQHDESEDSTADFGFAGYQSTPIHIYWDIDYDDGTWESLEAEVQYGFSYGFEVHQYY